MTSDAQLVPVRVSKVRAVVVVVVLRAQTWLPLTGAAVLQRSLVCRSDVLPGGRGEGHHLPISGLMWLPVMGLADDEEGA